MTEILIKPKFNIKKNIDFTYFSKINQLPVISNQIKKIQVVYSNKNFCLGDLFDVQIKISKLNKKKIRLKNSNIFFDNVGYNWENDILILEGDTGSFLGSKMKSGKILVTGSCLDFLGCEMTGGEIQLKGNAQNYLGSSFPGNKIGMNGGFINVQGSAGNYVGNSMRRGVILIEKNVGDFCGSDLIAGTILVNKNIGKNFCIGMKRGTLILLQETQIKNKIFFNSGIHDINFFSLLRNFLKEKTKFKISNSNTFYKFVVDKENFGLGELLILKR